jgi:pimeloyl-ACP methyl ester carboxylesterase
MTTTLASHTLDVPGARLHYETRGSGPVLAVIGLPMTGTGFEDLAAHLAEHYTVVTYDPRGFGHSTVEDPDQDATPELTADDVHRVLAEVTSEPALVFGSSGGAVTGLALAAQHPELVRVLVAHEPPVVRMLPDAEQALADARDVYDTYRTEGIGPAFGKFLAFAGFEMPAPDPEAPAPPPPSEQDQADGERMLAHSLLPVTGYRPDVAALTASPTRVVVAGGAASTADQLAYRTAVALADALGTELAVFPGGHGGFLDPAMSPGGSPREFARLLHEVLEQPT